jgi:hypothetical protein
VLQECYESVTRVLQECYKGVKSMLQECSPQRCGWRHSAKLFSVPHRVHGPTCYKCVTRVSEECHRSVTRVLCERATVLVVTYVEWQLQLCQFKHQASYTFVVVNGQ